MEEREPLAPGFVSLREYYSTAEISYINNAGSTGIGTVNPTGNRFEIYNYTHGASLTIREYLNAGLCRAAGKQTRLRVVGRYYEVYLNPATRGFVNEEAFEFYSWERFFLAITGIWTV